VTGADYIAHAIARRGLSEVFVYPGGTIAPILDALRLEGIEFFVSRHEQGAGYAAVARARIMRKAQVMMVTSGPGVTNVLTSIADAYFESTPLVLLTGQVGTGDLRSSRELRQRGFQEVDSPALARPITKAQFQPMSPDEVPEAIERAFALAETGRPGPVLVDLAMDVQRGEITGEPGVPQVQRDEVPVPDHDSIEQLATWLGEAQRPVILAGQGVHISGAYAQLRGLAERGGGIPVAQSLLGLGAFPTDSPLALGFHGHTGNQLASRAIHEADLLIAVGSRLDVRQTGSRVAEFVPQGRVVRIDVDASELVHTRVHTELAIQADAAAALDALDAALADRALPDWARWRAAVEEWRERYRLRFDATGLLKPQQVVEAASVATAGRSVVAVTGVGAHQQFVARHFDFDAPSRILLTSGGHGAMGYDVPSAMGAATTLPGHLVICFAGDGSVQMNIQEFATIVEHDLPVKIVVIDNHRLAMVSQFQNMNWGCDPTCGEKWNPDFAAIARAYGIEAATVDAADQLAPAFEAAFSHAGPYLIHAIVDPAEDVTPMLLADQAMDEMWEA